MSAPDTNIERQELNHKPSLMGIKGSMVFGALMMICLVFYTAINAEAPTEQTMTGDPIERIEAQQNSSFDTYAPGTNQSN